MNDCRTFRGALAARLSGGSTDLSDLSWHEHLNGCAACRGLLEAEEALELVLASLPDPDLPPHLARRVLSRLRHVADPLDVLLEGADPARRDPAIPVGLSSRVVRAVRERAEREPQDPLDRLLGRLPEPVIPVGLAERVLAGLAGERAQPVPVLGSLRRYLTLRRFVAAAVLMIGGALAWQIYVGGPARDQQLLAHLDTLENWQRIQQLTPVEREALSLDATDELLLELGGGAR